MFFETILLLFGIGVWDQGLQSVNIPPAFENISPVEKKWDFAPVISAKAVLVMDVDSAVVLYEKNGYTPLPMASLTKLTTALLIVENHDLNTVIQISKGAGHTTGSTMKLQYGEKISLKNLLYGLLLNSGNDSAIALARYHSKGTVYEFVDDMNTWGKKIGLQSSQYSNPHGFDSPYHSSSAYDIAKIAKIFLSHDILRKIVQTKEVTVFSADKKNSHVLKNTNKLLGTIYPVYGLKTGTTPKAGECLALLVKKNGREYIIIILGSEDRYLDAKILLWKILL